MSTRALFPPDMAVQDGAAPTGAAETVAVNEPLIAGADTTLWVGFGAFIAIFLIVIISIIRSRVIKPAERMASASDFFEPAGAGADITFDDPAQAQVHEIKKARKKRRAEKAAARQGLDRDEPIDVEPEEPAVAIASEETEEPDADPDAHPQMAEIAAAIDDAVIDDAAAADGAKDESAGPFANLFDQDQAREDAAAYEGDGEMLTLAETPNDVRLDHLPEVDQHYWDTERQRQETSAEYEHAEEERRLALEEAARASAEAEAAHRRLEVEREASVQAARSERHAIEAVQENRLQAMAEMQGKIDAMADRLAKDADTVETRLGAAIDKKFACLREDIQTRFNAFADDVESAQNKAAAAPREDDNAGAMVIAQHIDALQDATQSALSSLAERVDALRDAQASVTVAPEALQRLTAALNQRAAPAVAGALQLNELVRSALPSGRFAFDHELSNGANADCLITREGGAIAIDAGFPVEAFDRYARADAAAREHAATAYRRAVLRHMIFVAEKLVAPEETADYAILFTPNDTIFTDLHQNFADIIQDSYRARIWIASPTSLMAMLHMMSAVSGAEKDAREETAHTFESTISALTARIGALEENIEELRRKDIAAPAPAVSSKEAALSDEVSEAPITHAATSSPENEEAEVRIISDDPAPSDKDADKDDSAPSSFPLR